MDRPPRPYLFVHGWVSELGSIFALVIRAAVNLEPELQGPGFELLVSIISAKYLAWTCCPVVTLGNFEGNHQVVSPAAVPLKIPVSTLRAAQNENGPPQSG